MGRAAGQWSAQRDSGTACDLSVADNAHWHLWQDPLPRPGWANMAIDQALLERAARFGESWLRLYQWAPHCISFGRHEPAGRRYDRGLVAALGVDTVRRPTGGRAVWHAEELTYAVVALSSDFGSLPAAYLEIHSMLADALCEMGEPAYLAQPARTPPLDSGPCFSQPVGGEVMMAGRKVVGSAQLRHGGALLQHGSILLQDNQEFLLELSSGAAPTCHSAAPTAAWAQPPDLAQSIIRAAARRWPSAWTPGNEQEVMSSAASHYPRYRSAAWTWAR